MFFIFIVFSLISEGFTAGPNFRMGLELECEDIVMARIFAHQTYLYGDAIAHGGGPGIHVDELTYVHGRDVYGFQWFRESNPHVDDVNDHVGFWARKTHTINDANQRIPVNNIDRIFVAFRGSHWISDWIKNCYFPVVPLHDWEGSMVHAGFYERYQSIRDGSEIGIPQSAANHADGFIQFLDSCLALNGIVKANCEFIFVGHSTGAALATLACAKTSRDFNLMRNQTKLITFSSPKVGNERFANDVETLIGRVNIFRFHCNIDVVPFLPPTLSYKHVGIELPFKLDEAVYSYNFGNESTHANVLQGIPGNIMQYGSTAYSLFGRFGKFTLGDRFFRTLHAMPSQDLVRTIFIDAINSFWIDGVPTTNLGNIALLQAHRGILSFFMNSK